MRKIAPLAALSALIVLGACSSTPHGEAAMAAGMDAPTVDSVTASAQSQRDADALQALADSLSAAANAYSQAANLSADESYAGALRGLAGRRAKMAEDFAERLAGFGMSSANPPAAAAPAPVDLTQTDRVNAGEALLRGERRLSALMASAADDHRLSDEMRAFVRGKLVLIDADHARLLSALDALKPTA